MSNERTLSSEKMVCRICGYTAPFGMTPTGAPTCPKCRVVLVRGTLTSNTLSAEQQLVAGIRTAMAYLEGNPPMVSAALERLQEASDAYANAPETCERRNQDERTLRRLLAFAYSGSALYGDDGELQDGRRPMIDYVRDSVADIERKIHERGMAKLAAAACPECRYVIGHKAGCSSEKANQQANTSRPAVASDALGIAWWNGCSDAERAFWLEEANSRVPADAWQACKNSDKTYDGQQAEGMK